jgi:hypothetical protein
MQDRTPQIVEAGHHGTMYTGNYPSLLLWTIRKAGKRGVTVQGLLESLGLLSDRDLVALEFRAALGELLELELVGCPEYEAVPEEERVLDMKHVWRIK